MSAAILKAQRLPPNLGTEDTIQACDAGALPLLETQSEFAFGEEWGWPAYRQVPVERWSVQERNVQLDYVAEEVPVALLYNGEPHVVMMASPADLEDFAYGFSLSENIVAVPQDLKAVRIYQRAEGIELRMRISEEYAAALKGKERHLTGRSGCGLCGTATLRQAVRHPPPVEAGLRVEERELQQALQAMPAHQSINLMTGAAHAAAWIVPGKGIVYVREDIGRHNALDKLIGVLARTRSDYRAGFVLVTSRASYELVQKIAGVGISMLAAISAPTALAIRLAQEAGVTLVGFARGGRHVVYSHPQRLLHNDQ
ncbi:MAG: formate dehydrogenase accessory sulfurtransferase FdhD [Gammaproteobacteria bacterium]